MAMVPLLLIAGVEFGARLVFHLTVDSENQDNVRMFADRLESPEYIGHPFVHYAGNPGLPDPGKSNNFGFNDDDFVLHKPPGTIRVACLGGSTTMYGYPDKMEEILAQDPEEGVRYDVMNWGLVGWSSFHSLANLVLNVVEFEPDYVVIHHAWNEAWYLTQDCQRWDHIGNMHPTPNPLRWGEALVLRTSLAYRWSRWHRTESYATPFLDLAHEEGPLLCRGDDRMASFRRNVEAMIVQARSHGSVPVLTTQPYNRSWPMEDAAVTRAHFEECNQVMWQLHAEHSHEALFVDLDEAMADRADYFVDTAHCSEAGMRFKAQQVADAIEAHRR